MNRLRRLLLNSCRSSSDAVPPPPPLRRPSLDADSLSLAPSTPAYLWLKEAKWHVVSCDPTTATASPRSKIDSRTPDGDILSPSKFSARRKAKVCGGFEVKAVRESMAVVKRSEDPRRDFRRSMVEMVVEKGMYGADELEELLRCFLSLNSRQHHVAIAAAFADVWEALFAEDSGGYR